jgi:WD40 repeat protein
MAPIDLVPRETQLVVWDTATGSRLWSVELHTSEVFGNTLAFSADGKRLAAVLGTKGERPAQVVLWDASSGTECACWEGPAGVGISVAFRPDGRSLAAVIGKFGEGGERLVYDLMTGARRNFGSGYLQVTYSPDGTRLVGPLGNRVQMSERSRIGLRDAETGRLLLVLKGHTGSTDPYFDEQSFAYTADGHQIVSAVIAGKSLEVKRWDATPLPEAERR